MKPSLSWNVSGCAPAYIWYKQSDFCSLELYWQYLQKCWWTSGMIPENLTWIRFSASINTAYSNAPPINDSFLKFLNQTQIFALDFLAEYHIRKCFQYVASKYSSSKQILQVFFQLFTFFYADLAIPRTIPF